MGFVVTSDQTRIGFERHGTGPPLLLVHGGLGDRTRWNPLVEEIKDHFTIYAMDRRGRGLSGDGDVYSLWHEVDDVAAVANSIDGPVSVYGVSSGAVYALEAALKIPNLHKLVLYEPAIADGVEITPPDFVERLEKLIDDGKREEAIVAMLRDLVGLSPEELSEYRSQPSWPARVAAAHTIPREERTSNEYRFHPGKFQDFLTPTLLLMGTESPAFLKKSVKLVDATLPSSRVYVLDGQGHAADIVAPKIVARALREFLLGT
jgi:pimeloyl-ACP methyl ester carboxylesterase